MIIAKIDTFPLRIPSKASIQAAASAWGDEGLPVADSLLVRVTTDQGLEGWGETFGFRAVPLAPVDIVNNDCNAETKIQVSILRRSRERYLQVRRPHPLTRRSLPCLFYCAHRG